MAEADFSSLPEIAQIHLMKRLSLTDRGRLASCSSRLSTLMDSASVWKDITIPLTMDIITTEIYGCKEFGMVVDRLRKKDIIMFNKYGQHFERVRIVMSSAHISRASVAVLISLLYQSHVTTCNLSLRFDKVLSEAVACQAKYPVFERPTLTKLPEDMLLSNPISSPRERQEVVVVGEFIEKLRPNTDLTIQIPTYVGLNGIAQLSTLSVFDLYSTYGFYCNPRSQKCCSLLKKLVLSKVPQTEGELSLWQGMSSAPTIELISSLPNLQELHVNIINLSDQLLLELADSSGRRSALQTLVIRQEDLGKKLFPQLSSVAWGRLAEASPSLRVQCCVAEYYVTLLLEVVKPETPLVRLEVIFPNSTQNVSKNVKPMQKRLKHLFTSCTTLQELLCSVAEKPRPSLGLYP